MARAHLFFDMLADARFEAAAALQLDSPEYLSLAANRIMERGGDRRSAVPLLERAFVKSPANRDIQIALARAYASTGQYEKAALRARLIQSWSFENHELYEWAGELLIDMQGRLDTLESN